MATAIITALEAQVNKILGVKPKKGEDRQAYLTRIVTTVQNAPDDDWEKLDAATQRYLNEAAKAFENKKAIPDFPVEGEAPATKPGAAKKTAAAPATNGKAAGKPAAAKAPAAKEKEAKSKTPSLYRSIKLLIVGEPNIAIDDLVAGLKKKGFEPNVSTVQSVRADTRDTMRVLQEAGIIENMIT